MFIAAYNQGRLTFIFNIISCSSKSRAANHKRINPVDFQFSYRCPQNVRDARLTDIFENSKSFHCHKSFLRYKHNIAGCTTQFR